MTRPSCSAPGAGARFLAREHLNQRDGRGAIPELTQGLGGGAADKPVVVVEEFDQLRHGFSIADVAESPRGLGADVGIGIVTFGLERLQHALALKFAERLDGGEADDRIGIVQRVGDVGNLVAAADFAKDPHDLFADVAVRMVNVLRQLRQGGNGLATDDRFMGMKSGFAIFGDNRLDKGGDGLLVVGSGQRIGGAVANERVLVILEPGGDRVDDFGDAVLVVARQRDNVMMAVARTCQSESFNAATSGGIEDGSSKCASELAAAVRTSALSSRKASTQRLEIPPEHRESKRNVADEHREAIHP